VQCSEKRDRRIMSWWGVFVVAGAMKSEGDVQVSLV